MAKKTARKTAKSTDAAPTRAAGKTGAWRQVNRVQLGELLGVHPDTITDYARQGMPVVTAGGRGRESAYDAVDCLAWWRERQGKNAKEAAQTKLYENNAVLAEIKIAREEGALLPRDEVVEDGQSVIKGWTAQVRALPRRARHGGIISTPQQEAELSALCRNILTEISGWTTVADIDRSTKDADAV